MKKLLLLGGCLWALAALPASAQAGSADIVVVKVLESPLVTRIIIARSSGFPDELEIKAGFAGLASNEAAVARESTQKMQEILTKLYDQGYAVRSTFGGGDGGHSTLVLVKGQ